VGGRIRFALERFDSPRHSSHAAQLFSLGHMSYHVSRRWGGSDKNPTIEKMREALAELDVEDIEHCDVSLTHETGWCLEAYYTGLVVWEHLEEGEPRHMRCVSRDRVLELWQMLAKGEFAAIDTEAWKPGYG
jgi:hypothetical protein